MQKTLILILSIACCIIPVFSDNNPAESAQWQSKLVQVDKKGTISYHPDKDGYVIPDFSAAGYRGGGIPLPEVKVVHTISAIDGDNTAHIQAAIDKVGSMPLKNGIRGALLLEAGIYRVSGSIHVKYDGVVLRGEGQSESPETSTIIYATGNTPDKRTVVYAGTNKSPNDWRGISGKKVDIEDDYLPAGFKTIKLTTTEGFQIGDQVVLMHPATEAWIDAIDGGVGESKATPWEATSRFNIPYNRYIRAVDVKNNTITLDAPLFYGFRKSLSQAYVYKMNRSNIIREVGVENLRIDCEFNPKVTTTNSKLGTYMSDEKHAWIGLQFVSVENCWAKNITVKSVGGSGMMITRATRSTILDCSVLDPVSIISGERRYAFNTASYAQLILFKNCYARNSRHAFVSNGTTTASGNVFLYCNSELSYAANEGHRHWSSGFLYDNYRELSYNGTYKHTLALYNRGTYGSSHGWSMVTGVAWNCDLTANDPALGHLIIQQPPTGQNFAIGCKAAEIDGKGPFKAPEGYLEGNNRPGLFPVSLYEAQLYERLRSN